MQWAKKQSGFTIVELLIVIVVIAILAAITIVSFNGVTARAQDTQRIDAISKIRKGLEMYRAEKGEYPDSVNSFGTDTSLYPGNSWSISSLSPNAFLTNLRPYMQPIPLDPVNDSSYYFYYYFYRNNTGICGATTPNCYKLGISRLKILNGLEQAGVDKSGNDTWRHASAARPVWTGAY